MPFVPHQFSIEEIVISILIQNRFHAFYEIPKTSNITLEIKMLSRSFSTYRN